MMSKMLRVFSLAEVGLVTPIVVCGHKVVNMSTAWAYAEFVNKILYSFISDNSLTALANWRRAQNCPARIDKVKSVCALTQGHGSK